MKKILFVGFSIYMFAFNINQNYSCETLGFSFQKDGKVFNIPNDVKTYKKIHQDLGNLYEIGIKPLQKKIQVSVGNKKDILSYVKNLKNNIDVYVTDDNQVIVFVDKNSSQISLKIPSEKMIIYYQCEKR